MKRTRKQKPVNKAKPSTYRLNKAVQNKLNRASKATGVAKTKLIEQCVIAKYGTEEEKQRWLKK